MKAFYTNYVIPAFIELCRKHNINPGKKEFDEEAKKLLDSGTSLIGDIDLSDTILSQYELSEHDALVQINEIEEQIKAGKLRASEVVKQPVTEKNKNNPYVFMPSPHKQKIAKGQLMLQKQQQSKSPQQSQANKTQIVLSKRQAKKALALQLFNKTSMPQVNVEPVISNSNIAAEPTLNNNLMPQPKPINLLIISKYNYTVASFLSQIFDQEKTKIERDLNGNNTLLTELNINGENLKFAIYGAPTSDVKFDAVVMSFDLDDKPTLDYLEYWVAEGNNLSQVASAIKLVVGIRDEGYLIESATDETIPTFFFDKQAGDLASRIQTTSVSNDLIPGVYLKMSTENEEHHYTKEVLQTMLDLIKLCLELKTIDKSSEELQSVDNNSFGM